MTNIVNLKKTNTFKAVMVGALSLGILASGASAATSTAYISTGKNSAEGDTINIHDGSSRMTVTNSGGGPYQLIGQAKKYVAILPDPTVHTSYARPVTEVKTNFSPAKSTYYAAAYTEYNTTSLSGAVRITD
ncbi:hypothetical protein BAMA_24480 [Bacillus manliponensis]|uniref:Uncharacterized protein n=1 Tax=Bacillus manliponensis TaxID=574376 RepID=A0A073JVW8_9BACI|nr:hypothetical protein [Bacillus manliponensis]KEK19164.1 hypothetical protein BAMA_24480 [Bacillus manliponensis]